MIQKIVLRDQVSQWLQAQMLSGSIKTGQKLSLVQISKDIDVSVTPIREALSQLVRAGILQTISNKGFFVPKLSAQEARDIYPAIYSLEQLALIQSQYTKTHLNKLKEVQSEFEKAASQEEAVRFDLQFHETLIGNYQNQVVSQILQDLKTRVFFYELEFMKSANFKQSIQTHKEIIQALKLKNINQACSLLQKNWESSLLFIEQYYSANQNEENDKFSQ